MEKSKVLLLALVLLANPALAKFCSECGKPLSGENAKFCSECGAQASKVSDTDIQNKEIDSKSLAYVQEKLKSLDELCVYFDSSNKITVMQKFPDCKFRFTEALKELNKESLTEQQRAFVALLAFKWQLVESYYNKICHNINGSCESAYISKVNRGILEITNKNKSSEWIKRFFDLCLKCADLENYNCKVTNGYLDLSGGKYKDDFGIFKVYKGKAVRIIDVEENNFLVLGRDVSGWVNREEVYKRTNLKDRPAEAKIKEIDSIRKTLE